MDAANTVENLYPFPSENGTAQTDVAYSLACLEVRGGNRAAVSEAELPGLDAWISCRPLLPAIRGGDLYYLSLCSQGSVSRIALADVSGHGEEVGSVAEQLRDSLRDHADQWDQSALVRQLNDSFLQMLPGNKFATVVLLGHYEKTGEVLFTNAGQPPPLWRRVTTGEWSLLEEETPYSKDVADLPLGIIPGTTYTQAAVQLEPGDLLVLYTDGLIESSNDRGQKLGLAGLLELARQLPGDSAKAAGAGLLDSVARFRGQAPAKDDETVVALRSTTRGKVRL